MKQLFLLKVSLFVFCLIGCHTSSVKAHDYIIPAEEAVNFPAALSSPYYDIDLPVTYFNEIWAYLIAGREGDLSPHFPVSDIGYFGAEVNMYGELISVPDPGNISFFNGRIHLVIGCSSRALSYFVLKEGTPQRQALILDILDASVPFDGLQINFEYVPPRAGDYYISFLTELRNGLREDQIFSVAIAARTRTLQNDVYDYSLITPLVDRVLVMGYDEHWSGSAPGPIASMDWCRRVAAHALEMIGSEKLIMGLPFYGRTWGDINPNRAFFHVGIERIKMENGVTEINRENGIPNFTYETSLTVTVYYEDAYSLTSRLDMYKNMGVQSAGFWCLGQETEEIWSLIRLVQN